MNRRDVLKYGTSALLLSTGIVNASEDKKVKKTKHNITSQKKIENPRIVVVGGGWAGLALAKDVKHRVPHAEVTMVERRNHFVSCPMSNEWLVDLVDLEFLTHSYLDAANNNNYTYLHAEVIDVDKKHNILKTSMGDVGYDYLVFAVGIDYDYEDWTQGDKVLEQRFKTQYPAAFIPGSEHITLKEKIHNFKGGNFVLTVPSGNYRCLAAPYERACLIADYFDKHNIEGKVILLDANNDIKIKADGFHSAFKELYKDRIEYQSSVEIESIDLEKKIITTGFDDIAFDDASFYPNVKAPYLLEKLSMTRQTPYNRVEADINQYTYKFRGSDNIYACGDVRPMGFSKSGNTAYSEGLNLSKMIADEIAGRTPVWQSPVTTCFSILRTKPEKCISLYTEYAYDKKGGMLFKDNITDEAWKTNGLGKARVAYGWAESMYSNMFD